MSSLLIAQLPMYDWPEVREANDRLWRIVASECKNHGISAPKDLDRSIETPQAWRSPNLFLSQTCGFPLVTQLRHQVTVLGSFSYEMADQEGNYHSVIITHQNCPETLNQFKNKTLAINGYDSYSGYLAIKVLMTARQMPTAFFKTVLVTGSHRESIHAVVNGKADLAAIDCVSWHLATNFERASNTLKIIATSPTRPGLPLVTAPNASQTRVSILRDALRCGTKRLDNQSRDILGITSFVAKTENDYGVIHDDLKSNHSLSLSPVN